MSRSRGKRIALWGFGIVFGLIAVIAVGLVVWSQTGVMTAEPDALAAVREDPRIELTDTSTAIIMSPTGDTQRTTTADEGVGLVFVPGAKVQALAYAKTLSGVVAEDGVTVVITKPWLNLAFFDLRSLDHFTGLVPEVETWLVGGHSLGGVKACQFAPDTDGLILFASYCANDLSDSDIPVLSLAGSEDGLSTQEKVADSRGLLPTDAQLVEIEGANHASFGAYGPQSGDGEASIDEYAMLIRITDEISNYLDDTQISK
ncbi:alpha/beta hydrolase [Jonesia quinghaiensis]|uniref:alpha/beta hydrolase n=1 Tax=Jonesia quinghaiensis TaxID=262806 RepID=UPI000425DCF1|nr:alpha/beta hydrolase [Jonesia quinghaiensis]